VGVLGDGSSGYYDRRMHRPHAERYVLEKSALAIAEKAQDTYDLIEELHQAGLPPNHGAVAAAKRLRLELLGVKGDLERELSGLLLDCQRCGQRLHWVPGVGPLLGHWAHAEPAPEHPPVLPV
jgi:hypothetical protein